MSKWGEFRIKNTILIFMYFSTFFVVFHHKICDFTVFICLFEEVLDFHDRILTNQKQKLVIQNCQLDCMLNEYNKISCLVMIYGLNQSFNDSAGISFAQVLFAE